MTSQGSQTGARRVDQYAIEVLLLRREDVDGLDRSKAEPLGVFAHALKPLWQSIVRDDLSPIVHALGGVCRFASGSSADVEHAIAILRIEQLDHLHRGFVLRGG